MYSIKEELVNNTSLDINEVILESRIIPVFGYIDEDKAFTIISALKVLDNQNENKPIQLLIHGQGGDIYAVLSIIDVMSKISSPIETICLGKAFHLSLLLLALGDKRYASRNSHMLLQYPSQVTRNIQLNQCDHQLHLETLRQTIMTLFTEKTKNKAVNVEFNLNKGIYMDVYKALEYGLIDEVL